MSSHAKSTELKVGPSERGRARWPRVLTLALASYAFLGGLVTFFGWLLENYRLTDWQGRGISMKANSAILAMVMGLCLGLVVMLKRRSRRIVRALAGFAALVGALTLIQHLTDIDLGIDTLIFHEPVGARATAAPNRMGMPAAASYMCLGACGILLMGGATARRWAIVLGAVVVGIASISFVGFIYGAENTFAIPGLTGIAFQTSSMLLALGVGVILAVPEHAPGKLLVDPGSGGLLCRRTLLWIVVIPIVLGWLKTWGDDLKLYDVPTGRALLVLSLIGMYVALLLWTASAIRRHEGKAIETERVLAARSREFAAAEALARSRTDAVLEAMAQPLAIVGIGGEILRANSAFRELNRLPAVAPGTEETWVGGSGGSVRFAWDMFEVFDASGGWVMPPEWPIHLALGGRRVVGRELRLVRRGEGGGWSYTGVFKVVPMRAADGTVTSAVCTIEDVTARKKAEDALRENERLFSDLVEQAPMGVYVVDSKFRLVRVSAFALPTFRTINPLIGRDFDEIMEIIWGPEVGKACADIFRHTLATGERYVSPPFDQRRFDMEEQQAFEWETQRVRLPSGELGVVCYFKEVTQLTRAQAAARASEERTRLATEATGVGIWEWNVRTGQIRWNAQVFRIYGVPPTADGMVSYQTWAERVLAEDLPDQERLLRARLEQGGQGVREFRIRRGDGEIRYVRAVDTTRVGADGATEWVLGSNLDITELKFAEQHPGATGR